MKGLGMTVREKRMRVQRLRIRSKLLASGICPYPHDGHKTHTNAEALAQSEDVEVIVAGRVHAVRGHGKILFIDIEDATGIIQIIVKDDVAHTMLDVADIDESDFIRVSGKRYTTRSGQPSVLAIGLEMLSKAIRQLPDKQVGFSNEEARYRSRSVDLALNQEVREVFYKRARIVHAVRETLQRYGFMEAETPTLQPIYGGANARPFLTHINAWDLDLYLRIAPELYLKYLVMGGIERVYELTKNFRNEGVDRTHNPEFTMMECYAAYWDYTDMMTLTEEIYRHAALAVHGTARVPYQQEVLDFERPWRRLRLKDGIREYLNIDVDALSDAQLKKALRLHKIKYEGTWVRGLAIAKLFEPVEQYLIQPTFVMNMPRETTSLCKPHRNDSSLIERFEPYVMGWEIGNAYTELNDPVLQRQFWEQERKDDPEKHPLDEDFIKAMEYGMPPTGGLGLGIDRMVMLLTNQTKIRDVILFPTMKPLSTKTTQ